MDAVVAIVVVDAEEVDTSFNIHIDGVDHFVQLHNADELTSHIVDGQAVEVLAFEGDLRSGGVRIDASQLSGSLFHTISDGEDDRNQNLRQVLIVGVDDKFGAISRAHRQTNGVQSESNGLALAAHDGTFGLVDGGPSGGNEFTFTVGVDHPSTAEVASAVAVAEAVAVGAEPVAIGLFTVFAAIHSHRILTSGLFQSNSNPHGLTSHIDRLVERSGDPIRSNGGVHSLLGEEFTRLVVKALTVDAERIIVIRGRVSVNIELGRGNSHTHSSTSVCGSRQANTELTRVGIG